MALPHAIALQEDDATSRAEDLSGKPKSFTTKADAKEVSSLKSEIVKLEKQNKWITERFKGLCDVMTNTRNPEPSGDWVPISTSPASSISRR